MKWQVWAGVLWLGMTSGAWSQEAKAPAEAKAAQGVKLDLAEGETLVFLGDSITHQCLYTQYVEDYFYTRFPNRRVKFHNSGVGGDRAADALIRFDRDVAQYKPKYVTVLLGMNDGSYRGYDEATFQAYRTGMLEVIEKIKATGATPVLMTPTMFDAQAARARVKGEPDAATATRLELYNSVLAFYGTWLRGQAGTQGLGFVDMYSPLNNLTFEARRNDPQFTMIADAVHPGAAGQMVMAFSLLWDLQVPRPLSTIQVSRNAKGEAVAKATGGKISDVRFSDSGLEFVFAAEGLPFVVPDDAQPGAKMLRLGHRMSREAVEVHGLPVGRYRLVIDETPVGTYSNEQLERHVELQENDQTPQYIQAKSVATLNQQRNDEAVRPLRNLWRDQKVLRRTRDQLAAKPDDAGLKAAVTKLETSLADFDAQISALETKARAIEDRIYTQNQPTARKYRLEQVKAGAE